MQLGQRLVPMSIDLDSSPLYIRQDHAYFLKGVETAWTIKDGTGGNLGEIKPSESNYLYCSVDLPAGKNKVIGYHYHGEENTGYVVVGNSEGMHFIYRLLGNVGTCQIVYQFCKNFPGISLTPKYFFSEGRIVIKSICRIKPDGTSESYKEMLLVNTQVKNLRIVIEDSIATNSFTTPFFTPKNVCCGDRCRIIYSGVPTPMAQIKIEPIPATPADALKQNLMLDQMFQFRFVDENAWGQPSEAGFISDQYFNNLAGCSRDAGALPHCVWLNTKTPCPDIVRRTVLVRTCKLVSGAGNDGNLLSDWKEAFHIDLYDQTNPNLRWYERRYDTKNTEFEFFNDGKDMRIKFCNNRECKPIALANIRNENPAPIRSGSVASIGKGLAYANNWNNLKPFPKKDIESIQLTLESTASCDQKYADIIVYAVIHNIDDNQNNPVHRRKGLAAFGGFGQNPFIGGVRFEENVGEPETPLNVNGGHGQVFPAGIEGFRGRLSGTNFTAESVQHTYSASGVEKIGVIESTDAAKAYVDDVGWGRHWAIQRFYFPKVPCGTYFFEINSHTDDNGDVPFEKTSTYYLCNTSFGLYNQHWNLGTNNDKRIFIDTTNGNEWDGIKQDILAVVADLTHPKNLRSNGNRIIRGYVFEGRDNKIPVDMAECRSNYGGSYTDSNGVTDHNGFYFLVHTSGVNFTGQIFGRHKCQFGTLLGETARKTKEGTTLVSPIYAADKVIDYDTLACNRYLVKGKISECVTGGGIQGVAVILQRAAAVYSDSQGNFSVVAHFSNGLVTQDKLIFSLGGSCYVLDCNCKPINVKLTITQPACINCADNIVQVGSFSMRSIVTTGAPHGSRIPIAMTGIDLLGFRQTAAQTSEKLFIDIPSEQEQKGSGYQNIRITLPDQFSPEICKNYQRITFSAGKNLNFEDFITWAADEVDFVDNAGNKNISNPTKVKIWWRSHTRYDIFRGSNTNTKWSFLNAVYDTADPKKQLIDQSGNPVYNTQLGDIVEFIKTAEGEYLPPNLQGTVQYDRDGAYFLIDYTESLKVLKPGVYFKIKRPYACEINKSFTERGFSVNFCGNDCRPKDDDGNVVKSFILKVTESYTLPRQIPVVTDVLVPATTAGGEETTKEVQTIRSYPFAFEHHSPSDTWGDHCNNGGRINYVNPYEGEKCDSTQILSTGALNQANDGAVNYLHYFSLDEEYVLEEDGFGGITAMLVRNDQQVAVICALRTFVFRYNDNRAVVTEQGYIAVPLNKRFSKPETNPFAEFGCQITEVNTIRRADSLFTFLDIHKQAMVLHDFTEAEDISTATAQRGGIQSWLVPSIKEVNSKPDTKYWHGCFDFRLKKYFLTKFNLDTEEYVNNALENVIEFNETFAYNFETKQWSQAHFTPEYFGNMSADLKDKQFFSFKNGLPYAHHNAVNPSSTYLNYFGIQTIPVIGVVTNEGGSQEKSFVSTEVYCNELRFILEDVKTSMGQRSRTYEGQWSGIYEGMSSAPYLCDIQNADFLNENIQDILYDGQNLYGKWLKALYVPEPTYDGRFFLLSLIISNYSNRSNG